MQAVELAVNLQTHFEQDQTLNLLSAKAEEANTYLKKNRQGPSLRDLSKVAMPFILGTGCAFAARSFAGKDFSFNVKPLFNGALALTVVGVCCVVPRYYLSIRSLRPDLLSNLLANKLYTADECIALRAMKAYFEEADRVLGLAKDKAKRKEEEEKQRTTHLTRVLELDRLDKKGVEQRLGAIAPAFWMLGEQEQFSRIVHDLKDLGLDAKFLKLNQQQRDQIKAEVLREIPNMSSGRTFKDLSHVAKSRLEILYRDCDFGVRDNIKETMKEKDPRLLKFMRLAEQNVNTFMKDIFSQDLQKQGALNEDDEQKLRQATFLDGLGMNYYAHGEHGLGMSLHLAAFTKLREISQPNNDVILMTCRALDGLGRALRQKGCVKEAIQVHEKQMNILFNEYDFSQDSSVQPSPEVMLANAASNLSVALVCSVPPFLKVGLREECSLKKAFYLQCFAHSIRFKKGELRGISSSLGNLATKFSAFFADSRKVLKTASDKIRLSAALGEDPWGVAGAGMGEAKHLASQLSHENFETFKKRILTGIKGYNGIGDFDGIHECAIIIFKHANKELQKYLCHSGLLDLVQYLGIESEIALLEGANAGTERNSVGKEIVGILGNIETLPEESSHLPLLAEARKKMTLCLLDIVSKMKVVSLETENGPISSLSM